LAIILAAVHAARTKDIGELCLDGIDPNNRRLTLAGRTSLPTGRPSTSAGVATSLTSRPGMAGRSWPPSSTCIPAPWWAGAITDHDMALTHRAPPAGVISIAIAEPGIPHMNSHNTEAIRKARSRASFSAYIDMIIFGVSLE
jgi:hypothetical protein